jgi:hypothetical protein
MCFEGFCGCMPFSFHYALIMSHPEYVTAKLSGYETRRYQDIFYEKKLRGYSLTESEESELAAIQEKLNNFGELSMKIFRDVPKEMEETRRRSEDRLKASTRAFLFSCRAFQDALYALMLISQNQNP